jgi:hypothetical protein
MPPKIKGRAYWAKARPANHMPYRRNRITLKADLRRLSAAQLSAFQTMAGTYTPDLHDPAAVEVLLVLLEVCHVLNLSTHRLETIFGARTLYALETWGDIVPPKRRPPQLNRAWVWVPNRYGPQLFPIAADGAIWLYGCPPAREPAAETDDLAECAPPAPGASPGAECDADPVAAPDASPITVQHPVQEEAAL